jgi:hypothetical protein
MARVGSDIKLYEVLEKSDQPLTCAELSQNCGVDPVLMSESLICGYAFLY